MLEWRIAYNIDGHWLGGGIQYLLPTIMGQKS